MEHITITKAVLTGWIGAIGSFIASLFGGWDAAMATLCAFMLIDYITGLIVAGVFKKSTKTDNGGLESRAGYKGLIRKFGVLVFVFISVRLDAVIGTDYIKNCVILTFIANETISITENLGLMGVPLPSVIKNAIAILNKKGEGKDEKDI